MKLEIKIQSGSKASEHELELPGPAGLKPGSSSAASSEAWLKFDGQMVLADCKAIAPGVYSILLDGRSYEAHVSKPTGVAEADSGPYLVTVGLRHFLIEIRDPRRGRRHGAGVGDPGPQEIAAPMPGKIVKVLVAENQEVTRGQGLLVMEAMKMQNEIRSPRDGRVARIYAREETGVEAGFRLLRIV